MRVIQQRIDIAEKIFVVLVLFILSGSLFPFNMDEYATGGWEMSNASPNHIFWFVLGGIYSIIGLLLLYRWKGAIDAAKSCPWIILLLAFACCSIFWSTAPELTLRRAVAFLGTNMVGFYVASRFSLQETSNLLALSVVLAIILSLILVAFFPKYGINPAPHQGAWRGIFSQKNAAGIYFSVGFLVFLVNASFDKGARAPASLLGMACCAYLIYRADSKTAVVLLLLTGIAFVAFVALMPAARRTRMLWCVVIFVMAILVFWGGHNLLGKHQSNMQQVSVGTTGEDVSLYSDALQVLGRDATLTGRTVIWTEVLNKAIQRPVVGYGYVGYVWPPDIGTPYSQIRKAIKEKLNFYPNQSHNGYVHLFLALGGVGILLMLLIIGTLAKDWILCTMMGGIDYEVMWAGLFLVWFLAVNIAATIIGDQNLIYWPLLIVAATHLRKAKATRRSQYQTVGTNGREA